MAVKKVYVYENNGEMRVHPPVVVLLNHGDGHQVGQTDTLEVVNTLSERISLEVPGLTGGHFEVDPGSSRSVVAPAGIRAAHAFPVIGLATNRRAVAHSDPVVIIDT